MSNNKKPYEFGDPIWIDNTNGGTGGWNGWPNIGGPYTTDGTTTTGGNTGSIDHNALRIARIEDMLADIQKRLYIMENADPELVESLKEAYDHYKFIEKLCEESAKEKADE